jgi:hypothetical protein
MTDPTQTKYSPSEKQYIEIARRFTYHAPKPDQVPRYNSIRELANAFACHLVRTCPESRELSLAMTHLEEAVMQANAAIARNEG